MDPDNHSIPCEGTSATHLCDLIETFPYRRLVTRCAGPADQLMHCRCHARHAPEGLVEGRKLLYVKRIKPGCEEQWLALNSDRDPNIPDEVQCVNM